MFVEGCSFLCLESVKFHETSANHRNKAQIRNVQVAHNFITILFTILHFCPDNPNCFQASIPSGLLVWLMTVIKKMSMDPWSQGLQDFVLVEDFNLFSCPYLEIGLGISFV